MILINGAVGIGTGWSTDIPNFNPFDILVNINRAIASTHNSQQKNKPKKTSHI